eukprot:TRINITY_DN19833_c1_g1_i1.p1 TRINITY_DN19833_c1_g1~~TRINITY_DN19833_c1_g1_i1.p1  ORF type:complete len:123 (+),score=8.86 TRINITY_DN19833_c1_g1_i1:232-600(+)
MKKFKSSFWSKEKQPPTLEPSDSLFPQTVAPSMLCDALREVPTSKASLRHPFTQGIKLEVGFDGEFLSGCLRCHPNRILESNFRIWRLLQASSRQLVLIHAFHLVRRFPNVHFQTLSCSSWS